MAGVHKNMKPTCRALLVRSLLIICTLAFASGVICKGTRAVSAQTPNAQATAQSTATQSAAAPQSAATPQTSSTPDADLKLLAVSVTDEYGRNVTGLGREAFSVFDGDARQELLYFDAAESPQCVGFVFDLSRSMEGSGLDPARAAIVRLIQQAHASNKYFVVGFDGRARLVADWTSDEAALVDGLKKLEHVEKRKYGTALYDALALAAEKAAGGPCTRPAVIVVSDGRDTESETKLSTLRETLKRSGVLLYAVHAGPNDSLIAESRELEELANVTGGAAFFPVSGGGVSDAFQRIGLYLHSFYTVGFKPAASDGKWHKLKVKVKPPPKWPRLIARTREGFYAEAAGASK
jgi:Ca-activated chloride channel family protein